MVVFITTFLAALLVLLLWFAFDGIGPSIYLNTLLTSTAEHTIYTVVALAFACLIILFCLAVLIQHIIRKD